MNWEPTTDFTYFSIEWRDDHTPTWSRLESNTNIHQNSGPRVEIDSADTSADIRGIERRSGDIWLRVSGHIPGTTQKVTSDARTVPRTQGPVSVGHQRDNKVTYTLRQLGNSGLDQLVRDATSSAASAWSRIMSKLTSCNEQCPSSATDHLVTLEVQDTCWVGRHAVACVLPSFTGVEHRIGARTMIMSENPRDSNRSYIWTRRDGVGQHPVPLRPGYYWREVDAVLIHEFGHTFGLRNMKGENNLRGTPYEGIMVNDWDWTRVEADDEEVLKYIYKGHTANTGW